MMNEDEIENIIKKENSKYHLKRIKGFKESLVPQFYWGNINGAEIIILGKNPSYSIDDELDNKYLSEYLKKNLEYIKRDDEVVNLLTNANCEFSLSGTSRWWRNAFDGWELYKNCTDKNNFMNKVAIFNMYGFYSPSLSERPSKESYIKDEFKTKITDLLTSCKKVYIMWYSSINWWFGENGLLGLEIFNNIKEKLYVVNSKCSCNSKLKEAESYFEFVKRKKLNDIRNV